MTDIAKEYAAALFLLACEEKKQREYLTALETVSAAFEAEEQYLSLLSSPAIPQTERLSMIEEAFSETVPEQVLSFMQLMCERGRIELLPDAISEYSALLAASERISEATVTSAAALTDDEKNRLVSALEAKNKGRVKATYKVDPSLIGGIIVEMDGSVMDGSLRHRLHDVKEVIYS